MDRRIVICAFAFAAFIGAKVASAQAQAPPAARGGWQDMDSGVAGSTFTDPAERTAPKAASAQQPTRSASGLRFRFIGTGFVGSTFGDEAQGAAVDLGGSFTLRTHRHFGVEAVASFAPSVRMLTGTLKDTSRLGDLMFNAIGGTRVGGWYPYATGGVGLISFHSDALQNITVPEPCPSARCPPLERSYTLPGFNFGGGLMCLPARWAGKWGFRGGVRYISVLGSPKDGSEAFLNDIGYLRGNVGFSYFW